MTRIAVLALVATIVLGFSGARASGGSRQLRVAMVADVLLPDPHDFHNAAYRGFRRAVKEFGLQGRLIQFDPRHGPIPTVTSLARQRYDLILANPLFPGDIKAFFSLAARYPGSRFVMLERPYTPLPARAENVQGTVWHVEESSYLAGYLAALMEKRRPGKDVVGSVNGFSFANESFIAGYEAGARRADPGIRILRNESRSWGDAAKCRAVALQQIARGAGVVFNVAGGCGLGTLEAAQQERVWGIGVDVDQSYLGPHILTSVLKRFDVQAYETVEAFVRGRLKTGGNQVWNLRNGAVGLGRISPRVPRALVRKVERVRGQIAEGKIAVPSTLGRR